MAAELNDILSRSFEAQEMVYKSVDTVINRDETVNYPVEFLNTLNPPGMPSHHITLKVGAPVMLLRNLNPPKLSSGTRLQIKVLRRNVIEATVLRDVQKVKLYLFHAFQSSHQTTFSNLKDCNSRSGILRDDYQ
jgi:hypothetical protein